MRANQDAETLLFLGVNFTRLQTSLPPDPSLYILDNNSPAIYRFSLQLNLDRLLKPALDNGTEIPPKPASAFAVSPSQIVFIAYRDKVFYAPLAY
jgi:hypothetical protein